MIEIKGVRKEYISKRKEKKVALNNINIKFPDKGMCFILGETGSGKTTLLNLIGKLDTFDEGEIIVDGINIKSLSEKEANLYRSREIGFIFQEYNLIEEFDVYDNIALSYELQGKKINDLEIKENLKKVNLRGYEKKMINELSGGEKQRVTIARALIKEPRLILADEPTGALDNKTGRQILDILKEISKEHLVIVVSHNEEYAKEYGDIIVRIEEGQVKEIIGSNESKLYQEEVKIKEEKEGKGLSNLKALKLGIKNLKLKVKRLILMVLVSSISFFLLALILSFSFFGKDEYIKKMLKKDGITYTLLSEKDADTLNSGYDKCGYFFSEKDINALKKLGVNAYPIFNELDFELGENFLYYDKAYDSFMEINEDILNDLGFRMSYGRLPKSLNEVAITESDFLLFKENGYQNDGYKIIEEYKDVIGLKINYNEEEFTIVGIVNVSPLNQEKSVEIIKEFENNYWNLEHIIFVCKGYYFYDGDINNRNIGTINYELNGRAHKRNLLGTRPNEKSKDGLINKCDKLSEVTYFDSGKKELLDDEVIIDLDAIDNFDPILENTMKRLIYQHHNELFFSGDRRFLSPEDYKKYIYENKDITDENNYYYYYNQAINDICDKYFKKDSKTSFTVEYGFLYATNKKVLDLKIVGYTKNSKGMLFVNSNKAEELKEELLAYNFRRFAISSSERSNKLITENGYEFYDSYTINIREMRNILNEVKDIILIIIIFLSVLSIWLFTNYLLIIFDSTEKQNRILWTLGGSKKSIVKSLFFQGIITGTIVLIVTIIIFAIFKKPISLEVAEYIGTNIDIVSLGVGEISIIILEILLSIIFSIMLARKKISKKAV